MKLNFCPNKLISGIFVGVLLSIIGMMVIDKVSISEKTMDIIKEEVMVREGLITMKGNPLTLIGESLKVGDKAPDFTLVDSELNEKTLKYYDEKVKILSVTPSLDTPTCDAQVKRFNKEAVNMGKNIVILNISMDLPFALSRFCSVNNIKNVLTLSDYRGATFGLSYGVLIKELYLLTRAIFILDKDNIIRYIEIVPEVSGHPDYEQSLQALKKII